jgi:signal transduction histidine kinase
MAIVKAVVDQHGGTISVKSTPGQGTCVRVELPLGDALTSS